MTSWQFLVYDNICSLFTSRFQKYTAKKQFSFFYGLTKVVVNFPTKYFCYTHLHISQRLSFPIVK